MKILKINLSKSNKNNKGVVLVFALMIIFIVLTISLGLVSITVSELNFVTYSANSNKAFYAANTGVECFLYFDFKELYGSSVSCVNNTFTPHDFVEEQTDESYTYSQNLNLGDNTCAKVSISKTYQEGEDGEGGSWETKIISKGYNRDCGSTVSSKVIEREIEVNY